MTSDQKFDAAGLIFALWFLLNSTLCMGMNKIQSAIAETEPSCVCICETTVPLQESPTP